MNYKIFDNVLLKEQFKVIRDSILNNHFFEWYYQPGIASDDEPEHLESYFTHHFYNENNVTSKHYPILRPILTFLQPKALLRIKGNLFTRTNTLIKHFPHVDYDFEHKGAIFYLNTNDGKTILDDGIEIDSIENRVLLFEPHLNHSSTSCTNNKCRSNINFNFF